MTTNNDSNYDPARQPPIDIDDPLLKAISAPHAGGGLRVAVNSICQCLEAAHKLLPSERAEDWVSQARRLYRETEIYRELNIAMGVVASKESSRPVYSAFVDPAKCAIRKDRLDRVNAMLGIALIAAVSQNGVVPHSFTEHWQTLRRACLGRGRRDRDWDLMATDLPITQEELKAFLKIATHDGVRKFATDLLRMVAIAVALPAESSTTDEASAEHEAAEIDDDDEAESNFAEGQDLLEDSLKNQPPVAGKFIEWQMKGATFANYTDKVGLLVSANRIPPADLKILCEKLIFKIESADEKTQNFAFSAIVSLICALPIDIALELPLSDNGDIYLLLEEKMVCWSYRKVLERKGKSSPEDLASETTTGLMRVPIPLPEPVAAYGQLKLKSQPAATTLGELLFVPKAKAERALWLKEFGLCLRICGDDVYPPYPARFSRSLAYVYLEQTGQDLAAAMLAFGFATVAAGMLNYINLNRNQIEEYVNQVYDYLGLGQAASLPPDFDECGSSHAPNPADFTAGWNLMMQQIHESLLSAKKAKTDEEFIRSFNQFNTLHLTALVTLMGHRAQRLERLTFGALHSNPTAMHFADKDLTKSVSSRLVPKIQLLTELLEHHVINLRILARLCQARGLSCSVINEHSRGIHRFDRPAFFHIETRTAADGTKKLWRRRCIPAHIEESTQKYFKKKRNCGRHFWVSQGCRRLFDRWNLRVLTGHSRQDAEPFHEFGLVVPKLALANLEQEMDKSVTELGLKGPQQQTGHTKKNQSFGNFANLPLAKSYPTNEIRKPKIAGGQSTHQDNLFTSRSLPAIGLIDEVRSKLVYGAGNLTPGAGLLLHFACFDGVINLDDLKQVFQDLNKHLLHIEGKLVLCFCRSNSAQEVAIPVQPPTQIYLTTQNLNFELVNWKQAATGTAQWLRDTFPNFAWPSAPGGCSDVLLNCLSHWTHFYLPPIANSLYRPDSFAATFSRLSVLRLAGMKRPAGEIAFPSWSAQSRDLHQEKNQSLTEVLKALNHFADTKKQLGQNLLRAINLEAKLDSLSASFVGGPADIVARSIRHEIGKILKGAADRLELSSLSTYMSALRPALEAIPAYITIDSYLADDWNNFYSSVTYVERSKKKDEATIKQIKSLKEDRITAAKRFLNSLHELGFSIPDYLLGSLGRNKSIEAMRLPASSVYINDQTVKEIFDILQVSLSDYPTHAARANLKLKLLAEAVPLRFGNSASLPIACFTKNAGCLLIRDEGFSVSKSKRHQLVPISQNLQEQITELGNLLLSADHNAHFLYLKNESIHDLASDEWLHDLLTKLLKLTTGDSTARVHSFRAKVFAAHAIPDWSNTARQLLAGNAGPRACLSLFTCVEQLWTSLPKAAAEALHASRHTGAVYYLAGWPLIRAAALSATLVNTSPPANLPSILGFSDGAMRKARQRHGVAGSIFDDWLWLSKGLKFEGLSPYLASDRVDVPIASVSDSQGKLELPTFEKSVIYCARRMLNQTKSAAQSLLGLPTTLVSLLDSKLPSIDETLKLRERNNSPLDGRAVGADIRALDSSDSKIFISDRFGCALPHDHVLLAILCSSPQPDLATWKDDAAAYALLDDALQSLPSHLSLEIRFGQRHLLSGVAASLASNPRIVLGNVKRDLGTTPQVRVIYKAVGSRTDVSKGRLTTLIRILLQSVLIVQSIKK